MKWAERLAERLRRLVRDERGDSIAETLVAILIAALGAAALATMVMASTSAAMSTEQERARIYTAEGTMEPTSSDAQGEVRITVGGKPTTFKVMVYHDPDEVFYRYLDVSTTSE